MSRTIQEVTDGLVLEKQIKQSLIDQSNATTGKTDATLTDAVASLVEGYGQGGVDDITPLIGSVTFDYEAMEKHTEDIVLNLPNATSLAHMFRDVPIMCEKISISISSKCINLQGLFRTTGLTDKTKRNLKICELNGDTSNVTTFVNIFSARTDLEEIIGDLNCISALSLDGAFNNCGLLREVRFVAETIKLSIAFTHSPNLSDGSIQSIIDGLADITGEDAKTLTVSKGVEARMSEEQKATVTSKNWTLVVAS